jgi:hypothetical protein
MMGCAIVVTVAVLLFTHSAALTIIVGVICFGLTAVDVLERRFGKPRVRSPTEVAATLEGVLEGVVLYGGFDEQSWGEFLRYRIQNADLEQIRLRCVRLERDHPTRDSARPFSKAGEDALRGILRDVEELERKSWSS